MQVMIVKVLKFIKVVFTFPKYISLNLTTKYHHVCITFCYDKSILRFQNAIKLKLKLNTRNNEKMEFYCV